MGFCFLGVLSHTLRLEHRSSTLVAQSSTSIWYPSSLSSSIPLFPPFRYLCSASDANMTMTQKTKFPFALSSLSRVSPPSPHLGMNEMLVVAAIYHSYYLL